MAMFTGLATMGAGALLAAHEKRAFWAAARSFLALHLLLVGALVFIVGLSERRARAQYKEGVAGDPDSKPSTEAKPKA